MACACEEEAGIDGSLLPRFRASLINEVDRDRSRLIVFGEMADLRFGRRTGDKRIL